MAKVVGPLHSSEARGSVGSLTYNTWRGISIVKARAGPATQYSDAQVALRANTALATDDWQNLSDAHRQEWEQYALQHPDIDWTGNPQRLTGYNWFIRATVRAFLVGAGMRPSPPDIVINYRIFNLRTTPGVDFITILWQVTPLEPPGYFKVEAYGSKAHTPARHPTIKQCTRIGYDIADGLSLPWNDPGAGLHTIFARLIHTQGVVGPWHKTTGSPT